MVAHRFRTPYAEVDLIFESFAAGGSGSHTSGSGKPVAAQRSFTIIEVKSVDGDLWGRPPLTASQRVRLERARFWLESQKKCQVRLILACVTNVGAISYFEFPL